MRIHIETRAAIILGATMVVAGILISASLVAAGPLASSASQTAPNLMPYQGYATNASSQPLTGNYDVCFKLYNAPTGGTALWTECRMGANQAPFTNGVFNVLLGQITPLPDPFPPDPVYLGVTVGSDPEMTPRERLGSVPFALSAATIGRMKVEKYRVVYYNSTGLIEYLGPNGQFSYLNPTACANGQWCCNGDNSICYYNGTTDDSILEFSLEGAPSPACVLLHYDDDLPSYSKGIYYATDTGGSCNMGSWCARLSREGATDSPIVVNTGYYWLCGW